MLAGLYMLAAGTDEGFSEADKSAVEAVTNAGTAALHAEIESSPVTLGPSLLQDSRIKQALSGTPVTEGEEPPNLQDVLYEVANETLLKDYPLMSVAFIDKQAAVVAKTGMYETLFDELVALEDLKNSSGEVRFSATLGGKLYAVQVSRTETGAQGRRLVAIQALDLGGNSLLRRVLGTYPAGIVRDGEVVGDPMGNANPADLVALVTENIKAIPTSDASKVFTLGEGPNQRIGSISRVPGPAGKGKSPSYLAVLSLNTLGVVDRDLASALKTAKATGMSKVPWPLVGGFFVIALAFAIYLPHMESIAPMRRLAAEFNGIVEGSQHQVFHDTYRGELRNVARAAVNAQEAVRIAVEDEYANVADNGGYGGSVAAPSDSDYPADDQDDSELDDPGAIDLPSMDPSSGAIESHSHSEPEPQPEPDDEPPPPAFNAGDDDISADELGFGGGGLLGGGGGGGGLLGGGPSEPPPPAFNAGNPDAAASLLADDAASSDPKEAYFREVFDEFVALKQTCGEDTSKFGYDKFAAKLRKNTASLMNKDGVVDVEFNVYIKDGKAALKAKVVKG